MKEEISLGIAPGDFLAILAKGFYGAIPFIGPVVAEVVGTIIPNQRADRFVRFLVAIEERINKLEIDKAVLSDRFSNPEYLDLFEDGANQAVNAFSAERLKYIARILSDGLKDEVINHLKTKKLLQLLSQVSDPEIIYLNSYYLAQAGEPGEEDAFLRKHQNILEPKDNSFGLPKEMHKKNSEDFEIQESYVDTLVHLKLIAKGTSGTLSLTYLGTLFLKSITDVKKSDINDDQDA